MIKKIIIVIAIFGLGIFGATAQTTKFGHVDYVKVLDSIPAKIAADKTIQDFLEEGQKTIAEMQANFEEEYNKYMITQDSLSPIIREMKEKNLMEQQQLVQYKQESLQQDLQILNDRLYKPIEDGLTKAIEIIAKKHKVTYVLETNSILYVSGGLDLTKEVKTELIRILSTQ